ncbi:MAG: exodeoxyribonuclease VII large subunit [Clostridia bacterium]|nr:exodeoxyribonuclease VII large subunit [Clostridia bacterium]
MPDIALSVSQLNEYVKTRLNQDPLLKNALVKGEISEFKLQAGSGHAYFTLKDEHSSVSCVMWRTSVQMLSFAPKVGQKVVVAGQATLYPPTGKYQLVAASMKQEGIGDLFEKFNELKNKLMLEGLFDEAVKQPIPLHVSTIGVATSLSGAAIRDIIKVSRSRNPNINIIIASCAVQGRGAENEIAAAIAKLDADPRVEVILAGRGGGSLEDLWPFNEEIVARAIFNAKTPVISCVGHETDFSIADFAADLRASTPSNAAELAVMDVKEGADNVNHLFRRLNALVASAQQARRLRLSAIARAYPFAHPRETLINRRREKLDGCFEKLGQSRRRLADKKLTTLDALRRMLESLNPENVKKRGYACVRAGDEFLTDIGMVEQGQSLTVEMNSGEFDARVTLVRRNT